MIGLAKVAAKLFEKAICKKEQCSNWEKRPLRQSQMHYAALDAYVLVGIIKKMAEEGEKVGKPIAPEIKPLDNKEMKCAPMEDDDKFGDFVH